MTETKALELRPLKQSETIKIMLVEAKNEITKTEILERLLNRQLVRGNGRKEDTERLLGINQGKIKALMASLPDMEEFLAEALAKENDKSDTQ